MFALAQMSSDLKYALAGTLEPLRRMDQPGFDRRLFYRATFALERFGPQAQAAVPDLIASLTSEKFVGCVYFAAEALGRMGPAAESAIPELSMLTNHTHNAVQDAANLALRQVKRKIR